MKILLCPLSVLALVVLHVGPAIAGPFSQMFVFGDSLSDVGNISQTTFDVQPGPAYYADRFSNGPVYSEILAAELGLGTLTHSLAGGNDYAYGGALTTGSGFFASLVLDDVDDQVADYLQHRPVDPNALYVILAGANDFFTGQTNVNVPVNSLVDDLQSLINAQARNFLVMNLPLLGETPRFKNDPSGAAAMNSITMSYNTTLFSQLDILEDNEPQINLFRFDVAGLISDAIANPASFGFVNVTDSAAPGLTPGAALYDEDLIVSNPHEYLFWDDIHPTTAAHAILAQHALEAVRFDADFDFDGDVDSIDLIHPTQGWETRFGNDLDGLDFLTWQQQYGTSLSPFQATLAIPEPSSTLLFVSFILCGALAQTARGSQARRFVSSLRPPLRTD